MSIFGKEIEYIDEYKSDLNFYFLEGNRTFVVYRAEVSSHTTISFPKLVPTVDIVLVGAMYVELLSRFEKPKITKPNNNTSFELARKFDKGFEFLESDERVLKIESAGNSFYVVTAHLWIHEHNCQFRESFIKNYNYDSYLRTYVKNWIKIK